MNCSGIVFTGPVSNGALAYTGSPLAFLIVVAVLCMGLGLLFLLSGRRRRTPLGVVVLLLIGVAFAAGVVGSSSAQADPYCQPLTQDAITVTQTSIDVDLAPGVAPSLLVGRLTNTTDNALYITQVVVGIAGVTKAAGAPAGACDISDYVLVDPTMPVGQLMSPQASISFSGARIGFNDKSIDQDACKGAVLDLTYAAS